MRSVKRIYIPVILFANFKKYCKPITKILNQVPATQKYNITSRTRQVKFQLLLNKYQKL